MTNIVISLKESLDSDTGYGGWLKKSKSEGDLGTWLNDFIKNKKEEEPKIRVVHEVAKPIYSMSKLTSIFKQFFD